MKLFVPYLGDSISDFDEGSGSQIGMATDTITSDAGNDLNAEFPLGSLTFFSFQNLERGKK